MDYTRKHPPSPGSSATNLSCSLSQRISNYKRRRLHNLLHNPSPKLPQKEVMYNLATLLAFFNMWDQLGNWYRTPLQCCKTEKATFVRTSFLDTCFHGRWSLPTPQMIEQKKLTMLAPPRSSQLISSSPSLPPTNGNNCCRIEPAATVPNPKKPAKNRLARLLW